MPRARDQVSRRLSGRSLLWLMVLAATCCGCGTRTADVSSPEAVRVDAQALFDRFYGSTQERAAAGALADYALNGATARCMQAQGFSWDWATFTREPAPQDALAVSGWLAEPKALVRSRRLLAAAPGLRREIAMNDPHYPAEREEAVSGCLESKRQGVSDDEVDAIGRGPNNEKITRDWVEAVLSVTKRFGSAQDHDRCMTRAHLPMLDGNRYSEAAISLAFTEVEPPPGKIPLHGEPASREWKRYVALDERVAAADWNCRKDVYADGMANLALVLEKFQRSHEDEITAIEKQWLDVNEKAISLGWDPDTGRADNR